MSNGSASDWLAENLRLTAFTTGELIPADLSGSWKALVKDEPDTAEAKPKERLLRESGPFREAILIFRYVPQRIDWIVHPSETISETLDTIGRFVDETPPFVQLMKKWLGACPKIKRLAFGAVLLAPVSDHNEGYTKISEYLPFDVDLAAKSFMYQINRRRMSRLGVSGLEINRLSKWSCLERRTTQLLVGETATAHHDSPPQIAARLELDINTVPEYPNALDSGSLADLLEEFVDLGTEIAGKGDVP